MNLNKDMIRASIKDALDENPALFSDRINTILGVKVDDALQTKRWKCLMSGLMILSPLRTRKRNNTDDFNHRSNGREFY